MVDPVLTQRDLIEFLRDWPAIAGALGALVAQLPIKGITLWERMGALVAGFIAALLFSGILTWAVLDLDKRAQVGVSAACGLLLVFVVNLLAQLSNAKNLVQLIRAWRGK